ncbi:MAG TPA: arginine--tRNA ligase [Bryobacteraceae bacterium]|nr:arginine--tRNA ligase [Bryobacteraceae bacterium]
MFHLLEKQVLRAFSDHIRARYGAEVPVTVEQPKQTSFGELALPVAFQLAKALKKAPKAIAAELSSDLAGLPSISALEVAGNGYINVRFDRGAYGVAVLGGSSDRATQEGDAGRKIVVEHTNINPNKAAHIGHLRNAVLGDTFVRMLRAIGRQVEVQNYIDNTGVQVADVVVAFHYLDQKSPAEVAKLAEQPRFDYVCWDLYARISSHYKTNPDSLQWRAETLHALESGEGPVAELAHLVADAIVRAHLATMLRLDIVYDLLPRESEILQLQFWATAFELLKQRKAIYLETAGKNKGCWVMPGSAFVQGAAAEEGDEDLDKVIVRSNGTVTYVGKDIAYQLWKFGLLGKDFHYRKWMEYPDGHPLWVSTVAPEDGKAPGFGKAAQVYNVIDSRQSYLQDVVVAGLRALGFDQQADASVHFSYEMVALTPATCVELGIELSEEDKRRPYVEVSGRKGLGVKADDLIDRLIANALAEVESRHAARSDEDRRRIARQIAVGALRYFMLKFTRNSVIAFDFGEALSFEGETGPYVQYASVRARNILRKLEERGEALPDFSGLDEAAMGRQLASEDFWQLLLSASRAGVAIERAVTSGEPSHVARYAFQLAQSFNTFYHDYRVLDETDAEKRTFLLWMTGYFQAQLEKTLRVLGIEVPEYM